MAIGETGFLNSRLLFLPLALALTGIAAYIVKDIGPVLIYDREAILSGELWRLLTGHLVHFSTSHLIYNLSVAIIALLAIEHKGYPYSTHLCLICSVAISLVLLSFAPDMRYYGGLSGIAYGTVIYFSLHGMRERGVLRWICAMSIILMVCKGVFESIEGRSYFAVPSDSNFINTPLSHITGGVIAVFVFLYSTILASGDREAGRT